MILDELTDYAKQRVLIDMKKISFDEIKEQALSLKKSTFEFEKVLKKSKPAIICEVKKASPSKGVICENFDYLKIAQNYVVSGADCISVLTEPKWFLGSDQIFSEIRDNINIPMLRKDFTVSEYQLYQAKIMGADAVLLICAVLDTNTIHNCLEICDTLGLSAVVETHNTNEISSALSAGARIIGVNNRNLKSFSVDINNSKKLRSFIPDDITFIAESGIQSPRDGIDLITNGADALLIGEALMKSDNVQQFITQIKEGAKNDKN